MRLEIHRIPSQGLSMGFERPAQHFAGLKDLADSEVCEFLEPLAISLEVLPVRDFIRVKGRIDTTVRQACGRCLELFDSLLKSRFTLNFSKDIPADVHKADTDGIELTADQIGMIYFRGEEIDLTDALQEQVILSMPCKPLCRDDCKGLCTRCGHDLNMGPCQCAELPSAGPFAVLKDFKAPIKR